jgi:hypothetical protein
LADGLTAGALTTALPPSPETRWFNGCEIVQGFAYAASKLMGEKSCRAEAHRSGGALTSVCVRIGWCQQRENSPETINTSGRPSAEESTGPDSERGLRWFRNMWLSNQDFVAVIERDFSRRGKPGCNPASWPTTCRPTGTCRGASKPPRSSLTRSRTTMSGSTSPEAVEAFR